MISNKGILILTVVGAVAAAQTASAQTISSESIVGYNNPGTYINSLSFDYVTDNTEAYASVSDMTFSGLDNNNTPQTMTFSGWTASTSDYGQLHNATSVTVTNNYYNANNAPYDPNSNTGSPTTLVSLGFSTFTDTLQFGGALQAGYQAQYVFHVDGSVTGNLTESDGAGISVNLAGQNFSQGFFGSGPISADWATGMVNVNGITPQTIQVQFSSQAYDDCFYYGEGQTVSGTSDFSNTMTLVGVVIYDAQGNIVNPAGITVTSSSGTNYQVLSTPEPAPFAALGLGVAGLIGLRRRRRA